MASPSKRRRSFDVFLSFRGIDVRNNFVGHLYTALDQRGINTYMDSEKLRKGDQISPALMEAIEEARIAIIVFSKNYASSTWCLDELAKIMECKEQRGLMVFPVFYKVEPRVVRASGNGKGERQSYGEAVTEHEVKYEKDSEKVKRWKKALFEAGSLCGRPFNDGYEAGLIQDIVQDISTQLERTPLNVAKYPVGIDHRVQVLQRILNLQAKDDVFMVGLWGLGGVGKTTLAKAIYNVGFREFQGSSFLEHVGENSKNSKDLVALQEKLLSEVLMGKKLKVYNVDGGSQLIQDRLCNKKVLIILDDVDDEHQLSTLAGDCEWFGKGSRIIITTRNKHLLIAHGVDSDHLYKVEALKDGEALELFRKHAFIRSQKIEIRSNIVDRILHYAKGLPLALQVLGSFLCGRGEKEWKSTLQKLAKSPHKKINDVLKVSYDGLEENEKEIFLDIACFFKGLSTKYIKTVLSSCEFDTTIGIQILIEHSLISEEKGTLQMHDLIQLMGMDIVNEKCRDDPRKRSRLWLHDDALHVLSRDAGMNAIKAIVLKLLEPKETYIGTNAFTNMKKLRLLILHNVDNSFQGPIHLPNALRWFEWPHCASVPEFPEKLVGVDMQNSKIEVGLEQFKDHKKLKFINFSKCQSVINMPDLYCIPYLKELDLHGCKNLKHLPDVLRSKNLRLLNLSHCSKLQRFPNIPNKIKGLQRLDLRGTSIRKLPTSIENFVFLEDLILNECKKLAILPSSLYKLRNLKKLSLYGCSKLINFPKAKEDSSDLDTKLGFPKLEFLSLSRCNLSEVEFLENHSCFPSLITLRLSGNNFTKLPTCMQLYKLAELAISGCQGLQEILNIPRQLHCLYAIGCKSLRKIPSNMCDVGYSVDLGSCHELIRNGFNMNDLFRPEFFPPKYGSQEFFLPGEEMPDWLLPNKEGYLSFMVSKDLCKKIRGLAFGVVFGVKDRKESVRLKISSYLDGKWMCSQSFRRKLDSDHVWLWWSTPVGMWRRAIFCPNEWIHFQFIIRASRNIIVKKCGFRLICKSLKNELEFLLQHNHLLDPALLYEIQREDSQTSTVKESSSETEDLLYSKISMEGKSSSNLVLGGSNMADFSLQNFRCSLISPRYRNVCPGGAMPKEFIPVEDNTICFMASQDLFDKFLGLALCVVFNVEDGKREISFDIVPHVNNQKRNVLSGTLGSFDSDHTWIQYLKSNVLWGVLQGGIDFGEFGENYLQFSLVLKVSGGTVKKLGYVIRCRQLDSNLKVMLEDNQLVNPASLYEEDSDEPKYSEKENPLRWIYLKKVRKRRLEREFFRKCHIYTEELV